CGNSRKALPMSVINISAPPLSTYTARRLPRSPHRGRYWQRAVFHLQCAVGDAVEIARWGDPRFTADKVGAEVIDHSGELDSRALAVLHVLIGALVKQSKTAGTRNGNPHK